MKIEALSKSKAIKLSLRAQSALLYLSFHLINFVHSANSDVHVFQLILSKSEVFKAIVGKNKQKASGAKEY